MEHARNSRHFISCDPEKPPLRIAIRHSDGLRDGRCNSISTWPKCACSIITERNWRLERSTKILTATDLNNLEHHSKGIRWQQNKNIKYNTTDTWYYTLTHAHTHMDTQYCVFTKRIKLILNTNPVVLTVFQVPTPRHRLRNACKYTYTRK